MRIITFEAGDARVTGYLREDHDRLVHHKVRPAIVICPGGCYRWLSPREQDDPALAFLSMGYNAFILEYSTEEHASGFRPLRELAETVRIIRHHAASWHVDPEKIAVLGFSAGGHLAASLGALWNDPELGHSGESRPNALILCYPVISTSEFSHKESVQWVTGGNEDVRVKLNLHKRVTASFPPTFLWHGGEDDSVPPENSLLLATALRKAGVPFELHLFEKGAHGISTCTVEVETPEKRCAAWLPLAKDWLNARFQYEP